MKKIAIAVLSVVIFFLLCACGKSNDTQKSSTKPVESTSTQQPTTASEQQSPDVQTTTESTEEMFGYRYVVPERKISESKADGALFELKACDLFIFRKNTLEFSAWDEVIQQCEEDLFDALDSGINFRASKQTSTTDSPFTNKHGVEMMRVTGELSGSAGTKPYIAYYYVTDENYTRFMIVLNYEKESDAAKVIDYVAERLEKA